MDILHHHRPDDTDPAPEAGHTEGHTEEHAEGSTARYDEGHAAPSSTAIDVPSAPEPVGLYPHARRVGNLLFLSGVGPRVRGSKDIPGVTRDPAGNVVDHDIEAQCRSVFANVRAILEEAGSDWSKLVDVTVFLTDMQRDFAVYNRVYAEYFHDNQPCRTTVEISALPTPIAIELKCIAVV